MLPIRIYLDGHSTQGIRILVVYSRQSTWWIMVNHFLKLLHSVTMKSYAYAIKVFYENANSSVRDLQSKEVLNCMPLGISNKIVTQILHNIIILAKSKLFKPVDVFVMALNLNKYSTIHFSNDSLGNIFFTQINNFFNAI